MGARWWDVKKTGYAMALVLVAVLIPASVPSAAHGACRVPHLKGLTVKVARAHAANAGCSVRLRGAKVEKAAIQTISTVHGAHGDVVTLWVNPLCEGLPEQEPVLTPGPSELVTGLVGVVLTRPGDSQHTTGLWSEPKCHSPLVAGTITVSNEAGTVVATKTLEEGQFAKIPLSPGTYMILGTFAHDHEEGEKPAHSFPTPVTIPPDITVRQDVSPKGPNP